MKKIRKIGDKTCSRIDCPNNATMKLTDSDGIEHFLCPKHRRMLEEKIRNRIEEKYDGLTEQEIVDKIIEEGGDLL